MYQEKEYIPSPYITLSLTVRDNLCLLIPHSEGQSEYQEKGYTPAPYIHTVPHSKGQSVLTHPSQ